jgi:hypothetical protein
VGARIRPTPRKQEAAPPAIGGREHVSAGIVTVRVIDALGVADDQRNSGRAERERREERLRKLNAQVFDPEGNHLGALDLRLTPQVRPTVGVGDLVLDDRHRATLP